MKSESESIKVIWYTEENDQQILYDFYMLDSSSSNIQFIYTW